MNLILFEAEELGKRLPKHDERVVHLTKVLRKGAGDGFDAGVVGGKLGKGRIEAVGSDGSLSFSLLLDSEAPPPFPLRVAVGFPRPIQLRRLLRDLSGLGVLAVDLVGTELGEKSYRDTKLLQDGGARAALVEGAAQARDTRLPVLSTYASLASWLRAAPWGKVPRVLVAPDNVRPAASLSSLVFTGPDDGEVVLAIGSERGWSDAEREALEGAGFVRASMGVRALRTETACVAAAVLALEKIGALG
ncbi:MAG TPA: RNA methyltransferase [Treponema sp.]|nr:MAG: RNA methyltransferase [Treponema sp. GWC1_61_84]OHE71636.1 MAG: RNA methyltransferase [Treponema sp. RIFOXYC1_FULL_61_9]HCM25161.1 RNA methyltransferase [Treponema sp.]